MIERFLDDRVTLHAGDCREVLVTLPECSIDACVTDPPYHLTSIVQRFGAEDAAPAGEGVYRRASAGFMGKMWDGGNVAFDPATWRAVWRVLKPGAYLMAMGGTRTYHRLACAIEDAGFEIRDTISWLYGSGFPKSHDVSKGIDRRGGQQVSWFGPWLRKWRAERGIAQKDIAALFPSKTGGKTGCVANWELGFNLPTPEQFNLICSTFSLPFASMAEAEREVVGQYETDMGGLGGERLGKNGGDITAPATDAARRWDGWGTALKPACELIVLARKPLSEGTVAANVLRWGTGGLNIDGCRIMTGEDLNGGRYSDNKIGDDGNTYGSGINRRSENNYAQPLGRWPANLIHDGSEEVLAGFPDTDASSDRPRNNGAFDSVAKGHDYPHTTFGHADNGGSAARFFYTSKADADDRLGSKHPTVKPLDLMQYLARLVTPPRGTVLDPFAGTGTTGEAAWREGFSAVLIEAEAEYQADIRRRMALALSGPDERAREAIKARNLPRDDGPLFAPRETWADMWARPFDFSQLKDPPG